MSHHTNDNRYYRQLAQWLRLREGASPTEQAEWRQFLSTSVSDQPTILQRYRWQDTDESIISAIDATALNKWFQR